MSSQTCRPTIAFAAILTLAACASTAQGPPSPDTAKANLAVASHQAATSEASSPLGTSGLVLKPGNGYRKITKNGEEYYCRKEVVTGSRARSDVICLTRDEMTELNQNGQDLLNGLRAMPGVGQGVDGNGGMVNSAVNNMNTTGY